MASGRDEGPVYYREIQKNAYLKRIPNEPIGGKLRPLGQKKPPLKPMWTLLCVHNGRIPFLEQYPEADSPATLAHKPCWRVSLRTARHVTGSVKPRVKDEHDFLVDTDHGPVRMLAPDWDSMQDWVSTLRNKLHELRILSKGENVYMSPPAPPPPRAGTRDPTSPLPPTPPVPPDRVPGIELAPTHTTTAIEPNEPADDPAPSETTTTNPEMTQNTTLEQTQQQVEGNNVNSTEESVDISNWDVPFSSLPSTSQETRLDNKSVTKICGQNICLDDSILKRKTSEVTDSDEEFFAEIDKINNSIEKIDIDTQFDYKQRLVVNTDKAGTSHGDSHSLPQSTNITVIQVSNKDPPHTAIPVLGPETDVFDFEFKQKLTVEPETENFVNIVNTEIGVNTENGYGTVFSKESDYGHLSLTTTVNVTDGLTDVTLTAVKNDSVYERLCLASTSKNETASPLPIRKIKAADKIRKSSLPNLDFEGSSESTYEYLFPNNNRRVDVQNGEINSNSQRVNPMIANVNSIARVVRTSVERSHSQNTYDSTTRVSEQLTRSHNSPKREIKNDKIETQTKPIWKRGLTELSLLSKLRGLTQGKRQESPTRHENGTTDSVVTSQVKVVHRSRPETRVDSARRRSNSFSNGQSPPLQSLQPLRRRQACALRAEQRRGAAVPASIAHAHVPTFIDYNSQVWVAWWGAGGVRSGGRAGDRVVGVRGAAPRDAAHARHLAKNGHTHMVDLLFHRVPLAKIYVLNKRDNESLGIKLDSECNITSVERNSPAGRLTLPPGKWAVTEVNNRSINLIKGGEEEMNRLASHGSEVSILIQPSPLVKKMRAAIKSNKTLLNIR